MKKHLTAWSPAVVALVSGLVAWLGAFSDRDAFAVRALSASVALTALASALAWVRAWNGIGLAAALGAKVAAVLLLAPDGFSTLLQSYEQASKRFESHLVYFWAMPPVMLAIAIVEGWFLGVVLSKTKIRGTKLWALRYTLGIAAAAAVTVIAAWLGFRVEFYLWRLRQNDAPASYSLSKVGPRALPRIYREIQELGTTECGSYRSDLVQVIKDIRHDQIADSIGSPLVWEVEAALADPNPAMLDALRTAFNNEPDSKARYDMANWSSELDFNTVVPLFCEVFAATDPESQLALLRMIHWHAIRAYQPYSANGRSHSESYPWRDFDDAAIARTQATMRDKLACVPPLLLGALEAGPKNDVVWNAIELLAHMQPLEPAHTARLLRMVEQPRDANMLYELFGQAGRSAQLFGGDSAQLENALIAGYLATKNAELRNAYVGSASNRKGRYDAFFCKVFPKAPAEDGAMLIATLADGVAHDPCVATTLMGAYEKLALDEASDPLHRMTLEQALAALSDERIQPWAQALVERLPKGRASHRLDSLAHPG